MTYKEFIKRHRIQREEILDLLWHTSEEWQKAVSGTSLAYRHMFLEGIS
jgi:hypothetical protein